MKTNRFWTRRPFESTCKEIAIQSQVAHEEQRVRRDTSAISSAGGAAISFFGFRPGFGFAGMTHSLEAKEEARYSVRVQADIEVMT